MSDKIRNHATPEGRELGKMLTKWCDEAEPKARLRIPELPPRCQSCAFREGKHLANGSPYTQMDVLKCLTEGREFHCHQPDREGELCSGWTMMMLAEEKPNFREAPWPWSDEAAQETDNG